jgi:hypothetical protein
MFGKYYKLNFSKLSINSYGYTPFLKRRLNVLPFNFQNLFSKIFLVIGKSAFEFFKLFTRVSSDADKNWNESRNFILSREKLKNFSVVLGNILHC